MYLGGGEIKVAQVKIKLALRKSWEELFFGGEGKKKNKGLVRKPSVQV